MRIPFLAIALVIAATVFVPAHAQKATYYRWKDASGVTHYGDAPPASEKATPVKVNGSTTSSGSAPTASSVSASSAPGTAVAAPVPSGLAAAEQAARSRNCDNAKANLKTLSGNALLVDSSDPASAKRMTPEQLATAQRVANIDVAENCAKGTP